MQDNFDYIVVGSGATGAIAAKKIAESGVNIAILDIGNFENKYVSKIPNTDFISIRNNDQNQHRYFLGENFEGIPWDTSRVGSQLTPPRNYLLHLADKLAPMFSESFKPMESFAKGGLGGGWGLGCYVFSKNELDTIGLNYSEMMKSYQEVSDYIGISGEMDDAGPYCLSDLKNIQAPTKIEKNFDEILKKYQKNRQLLNRNNVFIGRTGLAVLTQDNGGRLAYKYKDMDFWTDKDQSAYRSWITIDELSKRDNFKYVDKCYVLKFEENENGVSVYVKRTDTNEEQIFTCKKLILSSGVLSTARIVVRSFNYINTNLPIISNPYCYVPCVQLKMIGKEIEQYKGSFSQLMIFLDEQKNNLNVSMASLYSYRSLLLFKLIKETPLNYADARIIMHYLQSSFIIAGIHHSDKHSENKYIELVKSGKYFSGDYLKAQYHLSDEQKKNNFQHEKKIKWALKKVGCIPLKTIYTPHGGSIHYAGTLPFNDNNELFTIHYNGRLAGTKNVFVADGSGFKYLPAKGLTLTLMANANNVAQHSLKNEQ